MEPQTPPTRRVGPAYTPRTPRGDPIEETHFLDTRKKLFAEEQASVMLTPRMTPRKRILHPPKTPQRGSGRQGKRSALRSNLEKIDEGVYVGFNQAANSLDWDPSHPHHDRPKDSTKGMWYVQKKKRIFRPFKDQKHCLPEPVSLFGECGSIANSDTDTDIE